MVYHVKNKKKIFNELFEEKSFQFQNLKERLNSNNLIYRYKTEGISPKYLLNIYYVYVIIKIRHIKFINLRDGNITPRKI